MYQFGVDITVYPNFNSGILFSGHLIVGIKKEDLQMPKKKNGSH